MKLYRCANSWYLMIGRLCIAVNWQIAFTVAVSLAPASRPWWTIGKGYVMTKDGLL